MRGQEEKLIVWGFKSDALTFWLSWWFLVYPIPDQIEIWKCWFLRRGETGVPGEKLNPHMASTAGFEPGSHWWEASALTAAPSLAPCVCCDKKKSCSLVTVCFLFICFRAYVSKRHM